jgi:N-acetylglutamate synthase-like GNAT family acetyltransferase
MSHAIREADQSDVPVITAVIRDSFRDVAVRFGLNEENCPKHPSNCRPEWIETALAKGVRYFVLEAGGRACGCVALERADPDVCYLERLAVLPEHRRHGYGRALVDHVAIAGKALGARRVEIGIIAEQVELKAWYQKMGFAETRRARFEHLPFEVQFMSMAV